VALDASSRGTPEPPSTITSSLLRRVVANDQQAWEQMVGLYYPMVYGWCRRSGLQSSDAADVCQDVFRGVVRGIGGFRRDKPGDTFRGWLRRITQRRVIDHRQARQSQAEPLLELGSRVPHAASAHPPGDELPESVKEPSLPHGVLDLVRSEFEQRTWNAFWKTTVDDRPAADVARELGMSVNAVYLAKSRVLRRLREELVDPFEAGFPERE